MQKGTRNSPVGHWWVGTLFGAEEIPAAIVTYVAMLMFLQADAGAALATGYCGLLFLPWVLKSFMRCCSCCWPSCLWVTIRVC